MEPSVNPAGWLLPLVHLRSVEIDGLRSCSAAGAGASALVLMSIGGSCLSISVGPAVPAAARSEP
jgi:hypothetical protein